MNAPDPADSQLLVRINTALAAANKAEKTAETVKTVLVSRSKVVGMLLLEAKKLHPAVKDFLAFLKRVDGLKRSRAYDLMCVAGGQKTVEEIREATRQRVRRHRSTKMLPKPRAGVRRFRYTDPCNGNRRGQHGGGQRGEGVGSLVGRIHLRSHDLSPENDRGR